MPTPVTFGSFNLNDGVAYFVLAKDFDTVSVKETQYKIARAEGVKTTGIQIDGRTRQLTVYVLGSSRADLEAKIDSMLAALSARQQQLAFHALDGRYEVADCVGVKIPIRKGNVIATTATLSFFAQRPYLYAASGSSYDSGAVLCTAVSGSMWQTGNLAIPSSGNIYSYPVLTLTNNTPLVQTHLTTGLTNGLNYTSLAVAATSAALASGAQLFLDDGAGHTQNVVLSAPASLGATSLSVTSFTANFSYPITTTQVYVDTRISALTLTQDPDGTSVMFSGLTGWTNGQSFILTCDPIAVNGLTGVITTAANNYLAFSGTFPLIEPTGTIINVEVTGVNAVNTPTLDVKATWTPRWLA